ncbi:MAG: outer membrane beta-barrel protein [Bacteroidales bacterium]|nr:outer membrane beta-barrel protein [Bacteroidales bacterium]MBO5500022.1 outer membrane beta-barrel protein [Bacteroidales bacterium]
MKPSLIKTIIILILLTISYVATAQIYVGGSLGGAYEDSPNTSTKSSAINVKPEVGFAFNENWAAGGRIAYSKSVSRTETPTLEETATDINLLTINPYAAYSLLKFKNFAVWGEFGVQVTPEQYGIDHTTFAGYITPVLTYSIGKHITLKTDLNFAGLFLTGTTDGGFAVAGSLGGDDAINFNDDLSIGFVYKF